MSGLLLGLYAVLADHAVGQGQVVQNVRVRVTAVSGRSVFIDKGRDAGIEPGDELTLFPRGQATVHAKVLSVSRTNSRAKILGPISLIAPGTMGTTQIPRARLAKTTSPNPPKDRREVLDHPPWQQPLSAQDEGKPLLAPVAGRTPSERPMRVRGRAWLNVTSSWNRGQVDQHFTLGNLGTELVASNPFGHGGELHVRGDWSHRRSEVDFQPDEDTSRARLDRLSYRYGHTSNASQRAQVGRFLQTMFPELGLVDGIEADTSLGSNHRIGLVVGGLPEPFVSQATGDDVQSALLWRYAAGEDDAFDVGLAYQKTWHKGSRDRDLILVNAHLRPWEDLTLYSSVWVDSYSTSERVQSAGFEVTEVMFNGSYRLSPGSGMGLGVSNIRWPDLARNEFSATAPSQILDSRVFRLTGNSWHELSERVRMTTRLTYWEDQAKDGINGDLGFSFRDFPSDRGTLDVHVFRSEGAFNDGYGGRLMFHHYGTTASLNAGYELSRYESDNPSTGESGFTTRHALTAGAQANLTGSTDLSINVDYRFGDSQDALTLSVYFQTRY